MREVDSLRLAMGNVMSRKKRPRSPLMTLEAPSQSFESLNMAPERNERQYVHCIDLVCSIEKKAAALRSIA